MSVVRSGRGHDVRDDSTDSLSEVSVIILYCIFLYISYYIIAFSCSFNFYSFSLFFIFCFLVAFVFYVDLKIYFYLFYMICRIFIFGRYQSHIFQFCLHQSHPHYYIFHVLQLILTQTRKDNFPRIILYQFRIDLQI